MREEDLIRSISEYPLEPVFETYRRRTGKRRMRIQREARELKRFLALCALYPGRELPMLAYADDLWHEFICHTQLYHDFCSRVAGFYIHHHPYTKKDLATTNLSAEPTLRLYEHHFGPLPRRLRAAGDCKTCASCYTCRG
jgi:hypothetical protein